MFPPEKTGTHRCTVTQQYCNASEHNVELSADGGVSAISTLFFYSVVDVLSQYTHSGFEQSNTILVDI